RSLVLDPLPSFPTRRSSDLIMEGASRDMKDRYGVLAYIMSVFQSATEADLIRFTLTLDGEQTEVEGIACLVANANKIGTLELTRSEEHTSELQSRENLVCRL